VYPCAGDGKGLAGQAWPPGEITVLLKEDSKGLLNGRRGFMIESKNWKILQIIPAQAGWKAVHCRELDNKQIEISNRCVICWALVESIGESAVVRTQVRGIEQKSNELVVVEDLINAEEAGGNGTDQNQYFLGYNDPDTHKESDYWIKQANERLRKEREKRLEREKGQAVFRAAS
jgi:hypothetical protein